MEHHLALQEGKNGCATYQGIYEHILYSYSQIFMHIFLFQK